MKPLKSAPEITTAKKVLQQEITGLAALKEWCSDDFLAAIKQIAKIKGRVIVSGMGKSGHIARKIAATFASTGTPAFFVHPGEASHGDLGMITPEDVVILLSNSGETKELKDIIEYTRRFTIPLIAIVRHPSSILVEAADIALVLPAIAEANSLNAPTTSTTMMLALGDALAVALLERHNFSPQDFTIFHPGGKLGKNFLQVSNLMHKGTSIPLVSAHQFMSEVIIEMTTKAFGCTGVLNAKGELIGIVTDGDLRRHMSPEITSLTAQQAMTANPLTISKNSLATQAMALMQHHAITTLFIINAKKEPTGLLHIHDLLRAGIT